MTVCLLFASAGIRFPEKPALSDSVKNLIRLLTEPEPSQVSLYYFFIFVCFCGVYICLYSMCDIDFAASDARRRSRTPMDSEGEHCGWRRHCDVVKAAHNASADF